MKIHIKRDCPHPSIKGTTWKKGLIVEVANSIGKGLVRSGVADMIPRNEGEWAIKRELEKRTPVKKSKKKESEG